MKDCFMMRDIAMKRRRKRLDGGAITFAGREFVFTLDKETLKPMSFVESERIESKMLVEEYMLLANVLVAEHLLEYSKEKTLVRLHNDVEEEKKVQFQEFFNRVGLGEVDLTTSATFSASLMTLQEKAKQSELEKLKYSVVTRKYLTGLQAAKYVCINDMPQEDYFHFGLQFPLYTHFTSPIRRYADLLVHRLITLSLEHKENTVNVIGGIDYTRLALDCSEKSLNAKRGGLQCVRLFHCLLLK